MTDKLRDKQRKINKRREKKKQLSKFKLEVEENKEKPKPKDKPKIPTMRDIIKLQGFHIAKLQKENNVLREILETYTFSE